jgi:hypothetical protein
MFATVADIPVITMREALAMEEVVGERARRRQLATLKQLQEDADLQATLPEGRTQTRDEIGAALGVSINTAASDLTISHAVKGLVSLVAQVRAKASPVVAAARSSYG